MGVKGKNLDCHENHPRTNREQTENKPGSCLILTYDFEPNEQEDRKKNAVKTNNLEVKKPNRFLWLKTFQVTP